MYNSKCRDFLKNQLIHESTSRLELTKLWDNFSIAWCLIKLLALQVNLMKKIAGCRISMHMKCGLVMEERGFCYVWG